MRAQNSLQSRTQCSLLSLFGVVLICASCQSSSTELRRQQLSQRLIDLEQRQGWHIVVHEMDDISYLSESQQKLVAIYSRLAVVKHSWIGFGSISSNGKQLILVTKPYEPLASTLTLVDLDSQKEQGLLTLPYVFAPKWSPNGKQFAFASRPESKGDFDLQVYDTTRSEASLLVAAELRSGEGYFDWSPDGQRIVYENVGGDIWIVDLRTKTKQFLGKGSLPTWSPAGRLICYRLDGQDAFALRDLQTDHTRVILKGKQASSPAWSPDGQFIAYSRPYSAIRKQIKDALMLADTNGDLWVMDVASEVQVKVFSAEESVYPTYWGPIAHRAESASAEAKER